MRLERSDLEAVLRLVHDADELVTDETPFSADPLARFASAFAYSFPDETASTTRKGSSAARCATSAASRPDWASKTKKQISSSGTWIERSKRTRVPSRVSSSAAERARRSRAVRSPAPPRARLDSTR